MEKDRQKMIGKDILTVEEAARYLRKSPSWVYKNAGRLGGRKLGGSLFFPAKEDLYEHLFSQGKGVEVRLHHQRKQVHGSLVQNQNRGEASRGKEKRGGKEPETTGENPNRHGILGFS
ncbi:MAG: helix-turn-helix domain-containing protein [Desulfobacteraceae bacterium]|nr:MAG: helix-turn-helix domain-containing protein [Desulfobacteraceae bacterium]